MPAIQAGPKVWTVRFKIHKITILLYVEPAQKLAAVKEELLLALRETHTSNHLQGQHGLYRIPDTVDGIQLARLVEDDGESPIWQPIEVEDQQQSTPASKGKDKVPIGVDRGSRETVQTAGISDGCIIGMRFRGTGSPASNSENGAEEQWDVLFPSNEGAGDMETGAG